MAEQHYSTSQGLALQVAVATLLTEGSVAPEEMLSCFTVVTDDDHEVLKMIEPAEAFCSCLLAQSNQQPGTNEFCRLPCALSVLSNLIVPGSQSCTCQKASVTAPP